MFRRTPPGPPPPGASHEDDSGLARGRPLLAEGRASPSEHAVDPAAPWCRLEDRSPSESDGTFLLLAVLKVSLKLKGQVTIKGLEETGGAEGEDSWVLADRTARRALQTNLAQCARGRRASSHLSQRGPWPRAPGGVRGSHGQTLFLHPPRVIQTYAHHRRGRGRPAPREFGPLQA